MSSSNLVQLIAVPEASYGKIAANLGTASGAVVRYTSESLSGTPQTTESAEARTDRMSGGQVVTGLESGGSISFELSADAVYQGFLLMAMMQKAWQPQALVSGTGTLTKNPTNDQLATLALTGADFNAAGILPGDVLLASGFTNASNNGPRQVVTVDSATQVTLVVPRDAVTEAGAPVVLQRPEYADIGADILSATLSKSYLDVTHAAATDEHSQRYSGSLVNSLSLDFTYGQIITGSFGFVSNGYLQESPSLAQQIVAAGGSVEPAGTAQPLNSSVDMGLVTVDGQPTDFCIESLSLTLDNGLSPQNCLGRIAPSRYNLGTASISISASIYNSDTSYDRFMSSKLTQQPIGFMFATSNEDGGYAFVLPAVQLSFPDPSSGGKDQQVMIDASGVAKVGPGGSSALRIYKW